MRVWPSSLTRFSTDTLKRIKAQQLKNEELEYTTIFLKKIRMNMGTKTPIKSVLRDIYLVHLGIHMFIEMFRKCGEHSYLGSSKLLISLNSIIIQGVDQMDVLPSSIPIPRLTSSG